MIRFVWEVTATVISLLIVCAEVYWLLWLCAWAITLGVRYPWITLPTALVSFIINRRAVAEAARTRLSWRRAFFGRPPQ